MASAAPPKWSLRRLPYILGGKIVLCCACQDFWKLKAALLCKSAACLVSNGHSYIFAGQKESAPGIPPHFESLCGGGGSGAMRQVLTSTSYKSIESTEKGVSWGDQMSSTSICHSRARKIARLFLPVGKLSIF